MTVIGLLKDGRIVARTSISRTAMAATTPTAVSLSVTDLRTVEYILRIGLYADGNVIASVTGTSVSGNAVGITVSAASGTTVFGEVVTVGF
jgi:hypothetical protein